ncbi:MAG: M48 family metalloprotease [Rhodoferax sp.]|nr:M48 family metalloprotease [Pseudorhodobacter sp.]
MQGKALLAAVLLITGCADGFAPKSVPLQRPEAAQTDPQPTPQQAVESFVAVIERVEPMAEKLCRDRTRGVNCDLQIFVDARVTQPPNAFQTVDKTGRPIVVFTIALIADARNADEIAFVMGHEASHHILGHITKRADAEQTTAVLAAVLAQSSGAGPDEVRNATKFGAEFGARVYSKDFELEADALGTEIAFLAGYDPVRGAAFFSRLPDPGDQFLGSHPPNAQRQAVVRQMAARLRN